MGNFTGVSVYIKLLSRENKPHETVTELEGVQKYNKKESWISKTGPIINNS